MKYFTLTHICFSAIIAFLSLNLQASEILITNANIYTLEKSEALIHGEILIRDQKIVGIGQKLQASENSQHIDAKGGSITPGLFNANTRIGVEEVSLIYQTVDSFTSLAGISASLRVADAFNFRSVAIPLNRSQGLSHALVVPQSGNSLIAGQVALVDLSGQADSIINPYVALKINYGEKGQHLAGGSRAAALQQLREAFADARDYADNKAAFNVGQRRQYALSRLDLEALLPVVRGEKPIIVDVSRASDILSILDFAKQEQVKLILSQAEEAWLVANEIAAAEVPVIIDPIENLPTRYESLAARADNAALLNQAGVTLVFTGMSWLNTHSAYLVRQSAGNAVANGLDKLTALKAMTINPRQVFQAFPDSGVVRQGEPANLVLWSGDPLEMTSTVELVLVNGKQMPLESRASQLAQRYFKKFQALQK